MAKLLLVEDNLTLANNILNIISSHEGFEIKLVQTYEEAKNALKKHRYEFGVASLKLSDAKNGEIIALFNKHNVSPIIIIDEFDENFSDTYESASITTYILKQEENIEKIVVDKLRQLVLNKDTTILIISNSQTYTNYLKHNLSMHNFEILIATNSADTLRKISIHKKIDLIITEYDLPYINGLELVKKIRETKDKNELKILTLSNDPESEITLSFLQEGVNDYLVKPFSRDELYISVYKNVNSTLVDFV